MPEVDWSRWHTAYDAAVAAARETHKPILLQFHRDKCAGCKKLYALTYPDPDVAAELYDWFVPLRLDILQNREIRARLAAVWTPSFYVLDWQGKQYFHLTATSARRIFASSCAWPKPRWTRPAAATMR